MTEINQVYKCPVCGNIVEIVHTGAGELVCCGQPMILQQENTVDAAIEKHVPVIEENDDGILVRVGSAEHPMTDDHYIEWVELIADGQVCRVELKPGDKPEARFCVKGNNLAARAYCNLHGMWKA